MRSPTYLYLRGNIYYFQIRIPRHMLNKGNYPKEFVRRSTGTGNKRQVLMIARRWWYEFMTDKKTTDFNKIQQEIDKSAEKHAYLYSRGRYLYGELTKVDSQDLNEIEDFFTSTAYKEHDIEAINLYQDSYSYMIRGILSLR